jgi:branched-chain amino acid transport system permease protein
VVIIRAFDLELLPGLAILFAGGGVIGTVGGSLWLIAEKWREPLINAFVWTLLAGLLQQVFQQVLRGVRLDAVAQALYSPLGGLQPLSAIVLFPLVFGLYTYLERREVSLRERYDALPDDRRRNVLIAGTVVGLAVIVVLPQILGVFLSEVLDLVGIFLLMGLGLNLVVGFAGLLDLGYVAFFAVGAYVTAVLTSGGSPAFAPEITFWMALPFVIGVAALAGIIVGTPVLRMRGDYLAIVTLGFGEIARILFISEALFPYVGGAQGITKIPTISVGGFAANSPPEFFYPIAAFVILAIYVTWALENSRIGRMWKAMREDEPVAEVMGINTVQAKLTAFIMGAIIASFGGALFASKIGSVFPHSFNIVVSIQVLVLIIVGGMGSIPGVIVGAIVIIGLPELLREFAEFKFLLYGALLIYMMLNKPEGFVPSRERMRELHQEEMMQDAWLADEQARKEQEARESATVARGRESA